MTDFHNPYHFVPVQLPKTEEWMTRKQFEQRTFADAERPNTPHPEADQSRYLKGDDIFHGRLVCRLTTETPIFIGAQRYKEASDHAPAEVAPFELGGCPAIPASSLRGMISAIAEAASGSALRVLEDRVLSYRKEARVPLKKLGMVFWRQEKLCLLHLPDPIKVDRDLVEQERSFRWDKKNFYYGRKGKKNFSEAGDLLNEKDFQDLIGEHPSQEQNYQMGLLRIMGCEERTDLPKDRSHELFIPFGYRDHEELLAVGGKSIHDIPKEVVARFELLADERTDATEKHGELRIHPYEPKGTLRNLEKDPRNQKLRLKPGDLVYFESNQSNQVTEMAFSAIWRAPVLDRRAKQSVPAKVWRFFEQRSRNGNNRELLPFHTERQFISPAELLFGFVEERDRNKQFDTAALAYASRVCFSNALLGFEQENNHPYLAAVPLKILDSPKPPSPSLYFKHKSGTGFIAKADLNPDRHEPQGRKFYLHHPDDKSEPWRTRMTKGKEARWKQKVKVTPLRPKLTFHFHIDFNNLTRYELGMLCHALQPGDGFRHKIGMGKPIGLGSVKIEPLVLYSIDRAVRYRSSNPFGEPRYHAAQLLNNMTSIDELPQHYRYEGVEKESGKESLGEIVDGFKATMDQAVDGAIQLLGNPKNVTNLVNTPLRQYQKNFEQETFKWFVENERKRAQSLEPLGAETTKLPTLKRN